MTSEVRQVVKECVECQKSNKSKLGKAPLVNLPVVTTPFDRIAIDVVGPLPLTSRENRYILTIMDIATPLPRGNSSPKGGHGKRLRYPD